MEKLDDISWLWAAKVIRLADTSFLWREKDEGPNDTSKIPKPTFQHEEIGQFYDEYLSRPIVKGKQRAVISKLLVLLDTEGDCPSVVGRGEAYKHEAEREIGDELYQFLAMVPLWKHSLLVARKYVAKFSYDVMVPDALIVSLGHDIGKIPRYYSKIYKSADHAALSTNILNSMPEYAALSNRSELSRMIMSHHFLVTGSTLADHLKAADSEARQVEGEGLVAWLDAKAEAPPSSTAEQKPSTQTANPPAEKSKPQEEVEKKASTPSPRKNPAKPKASSDTPPPPPSVANAYANESGSITKGKHVCTESALPEWFNSEALLLEIRESINKVVTDNAKTTWMAVSDDRTGIVWVDERAVWAALKKMSANKDMKLLLADANVADRRDYLYSVVRELGRQQKVHASMMATGYYQVPVSVITVGAKSITMFLIPFLPEAFGTTIADLATKKGDLINRMVTRIVPKQHEVKQCSNAS